MFDSSFVRVSLEADASLQVDSKLIVSPQYLARLLEDTFPRQFKEYLARRVNDRADIGPVRRHVGPAHLRHLHHAGEQHKRLGGVRVLAAGHRRHLRRQFQGAECHELQLAAGAGHESAGSATRSVHQRLAHTTGSDAQLHQHALADGRVGAELFRPADRYTHQFPVSENHSRAASRNIN